MHTWLPITETTVLHKGDLIKTPGDDVGRVISAARIIGIVWLRPRVYDACPYILSELTPCIYHRTLCPKEAL